MDQKYELSSKKFSHELGWRSREKTLRRRASLSWLEIIDKTSESLFTLSLRCSRNLLDDVIKKETLAASALARNDSQETNVAIIDIPHSSRRVGLVVRKIGMLPQWTNDGNRILCTVLEVDENHVVSVTSPDSWYKASAVGKRKAFNRHGPMWRVTVGAGNDDPTKYTLAYRRQFARAGVPTKGKERTFENVRIYFEEKTLFVFQNQFLYFRKTWMFLGN